MYRKSETDIFAIDENPKEIDQFWYIENVHTPFTLTIKTYLHIALSVFIVTLVR